MPSEVRRIYPKDPLVFTSFSNEADDNEIPLRQAISILERARDKLTAFGEATKNTAHVRGWKEIEVVFRYDLTEEDILKRRIEATLQALRGKLLPDVAGNEEHNAEIRRLIQMLAAG